MSSVNAQSAAVLRKNDGAQKIGTASGKTVQESLNELRNKTSGDTALLENLAAELEKVDSDWQESVAGVEAAMVSTLRVLADQAVNQFNLQEALNEVIN